MIEVVAAIIEKNNKILIAKRNSKAKQGGLWEFPGGKVNAKESYEQALIREINEELSMNIGSIVYYGENIYEYPDITIKLIAFKCSLISEQYQIKEHEAIKWVNVEQLRNYNFLKQIYIL